MPRPLYDAREHPLLSETLQKLSPDEFYEENVLAETFLELTAPAYTDEDIVETILEGVVVQMNFQKGLGDGRFEQTIATAHSNPPGASTTHRDRYISPRAAALIAFATGKKAVRFTPLHLGT